MSTDTRKLVTIITESALEHSLVDDFERLGAHGYTITNARGKGHPSPDIFGSTTTPTMP